MRSLVKSMPSEDAYVSLLGEMVIEVSEVQPSKVLVAIDVMVEGKVTERRLVQSLKTGVFEFWVWVLGSWEVLLSGEVFEFWEVSENRPKNAPPQRF